MSQDLDSDHRNKIHLGIKWEWNIHDTYRHAQYYKVSFCFHTVTVYVCVYLWARDVTFGHGSLLWLFNYIVFNWFNWFVCYWCLFPTFFPRFSPLPTVLMSNQRHSIIYYWISKSNSSKDSCCELECNTLDGFTRRWLRKWLSQRINV